MGKKSFISKLVLIAVVAIVAVAPRFSIVPNAMGKTGATNGLVRHLNAGGSLLGETTERAQHVDEMRTADEPVQEDCGDGIDNDGDALVDEADPDCHPTEDCSNGIDDDGDGKVDGADSDCGTGTTPENCTNGVDDDGDGAVDAADTDCQTKELNCNNGLDDDGDGLIDGNDPDCPQLPGFSCRASVARIELLGLEPFIANPARVPCISARADLLEDTTLGAMGAPGSLIIGVANAVTTNAPTEAKAESQVASVVITDATGVPMLRLRALHSVARSRCIAPNTADEEGTSSVILIGPTGSEQEYTDFTTIPLGPLGNLHLNFAEDTGNRLTMRTVFLDSDVLGDIVLAESIADHGAPVCGGGGTGTGTGTGTP